MNKLRLKYIQNWSELARQANWSVTALARICGVSVRGLELYFRKARGITPKAWLAEKRQKQALELLRHGASVKATAAELGYKHAHHFSRTFKKTFRAKSDAYDADGLPKLKISRFGMKFCVGRPLPLPLGRNAINFARNHESVIRRNRGTARRPIGGCHAVVQKDATPRRAILRG